MAPLCSICLMYVCAFVREPIYSTPHFQWKKKIINEAHFFLESSSIPTETLTHFSQLPLHFVIFNTPTRLLSYLVRYRGQSVKSRWQLIDTIFFSSTVFQQKTCKMFWFFVQNLLNRLVHIYITRLVLCSHASWLKVKKCLRFFFLT